MKPPTWLLRAAEPRMRDLDQRVRDLQHQLVDMADSTRDQVAAAHRRELAAVRQVEALQLRLLNVQHQSTELTRARRTLHDYEDQLAACREQHGGNSRPVTRSNLAVCVFCGQRTAGALADCDQDDCRRRGIELEMVFVRREDQ